MAIYVYVKVHKYEYLQFIVFCRFRYFTQICLPFSFIWVCYICRSQASKKIISENRMYLLDFINGTHLRTASDLLFHLFTSLSSGIILTVIILLINEVFD